MHVTKCLYAPHNVLLCYGNHGMDVCTSVEDKSREEKLPDSNENPSPNLMYLKCYRN